MSAPVAAPALPAPAVVERHVRKPRPAVAPVVEEKPAREESEPAVEEKPVPLPDAGATGGVEAPGGEPVPAEDEEPLLADEEPDAAGGESEPAAGPEITPEPVAAPASQPPPPSRR